MLLTRKQARVRCAPWDRIRGFVQVPCYVVFLAASSCAPTNGVLNSSYEVATVSTRPSGARMQSEFSGTLGGQVNHDGTACFWLGSGQNRTVLIWPGGYSGRGAPPSIVDQRGQILASVGQQVTLGGGTISPAASSILGCPPTAEAFEVGEVLQ